jgi:hypothetical protein
LKGKWLRLGVPFLVYALLAPPGCHSEVDEWRGAEAEQSISLLEGIEGCAGAGVVLCFVACFDTL